MASEKTTGVPPHPCPGNGVYRAAGVKSPRLRRWGSNGVASGAGRGLQTVPQLLVPEHSIAWRDDGKKLKPNPLRTHGNRGPLTRALNVIGSRRSSAMELRTDE